MTTEQVEFQVAGVTFEGRQDILQDIKESSSWEMLPMMDAELVREPSNKYDKNAIKVMVNKKQLGYVPRDLAADLSPKLRQKKIDVDECHLVGLNRVPGKDIIGAKIRLTFSEKKAKTSKRSRR